MYRQFLAPKPARRQAEVYGSGIDMRAGLKDYALIAALQDTRFDPITTRELPHLTCGLSLLTDFEDGLGHLDWEARLFLP